MLLCLVVCCVLFRVVVSYGGFSGLVLCLVVSSCVLCCCVVLLTYAVCSAVSCCVISIALCYCVVLDCVVLHCCAFLSFCVVSLSSFVIFFATLRCISILLLLFDTFL